MWEAIKGGLHTQPWHHGIKSTQQWPRVAKIWPSFKLQLHSYSVRVHLFAYLPHWKVLNHFIYVHYAFGEQSAMVYSLNHNIMESLLLDSNQELPKSDPALAA
jgi:hypothetical protein